ncbi:toprim domain-containing protein [Stieleria varia]|uniref:Zinc-binding domain of primase-helicase n=1 Tax=Stieleria varia TaxID=2528005 RepID=A0A5C6B640_9BACT|nr:toprim domain-containing protein [Stieleria varia]TWU07755.1 Zinc-binding domain of primase-helicase [Stieleria varia]
MTKLIQHCVVPVNAFPVSWSSVMSLLSADDVRVAATGHWAFLLSRAGIPIEHLDGRGHPCPRCGGHDRFAAFDQLPIRGGVHCRRCFTRGTDPRPGDGISTVRWMLGCGFVDALRWIADQLGIDTTLSTKHSSLASASPTIAAPRPSISNDEVGRWTAVAKTAYRDMPGSMRDQLAASLGVTTQSLDHLRVGLDQSTGASTWPMRDADGNVIGVRMRDWRRTGQKWSLIGSHSGLFFHRVRPNDVPRGRLFIVEGASDTAAALSMGLWAIGRASCSSSSRFVLDYVRRHTPEKITLIADNDEAGIGGARRLATQIQHRGHRVEILIPPSEYSDLRQWHWHGADRDLVIGHRVLESLPAIMMPQQLLLGFDVSLSDAMTR